MNNKKAKQSIADHLKHTKIIYRNGHSKEIEWNGVVAHFIPLEIAHQLLRMGYNYVTQNPYLNGEENKSQASLIAHKCEPKFVLRGIANPYTPRCCSASSWDSEGEKLVLVGRGYDEGKSPFDLKKIIVGKAGGKWDCTAEEFMIRSFYRMNTEKYNGYITKIRG